jgi:putative acetyltransferase
MNWIFQSVIAYADPYLDLMFEEYNKPKSVYYVVENNGKVVGSAGRSPWKWSSNYLWIAENVFFAETRGLGIGVKWWLCA